MLINTATHQRETLTEWPIRLPLIFLKNTFNKFKLTNNQSQKACLFESNQWK